MTTELANYLMTESEFSQYKREILAKTNAGNIHDVTSKLGTIQGFLELSEAYPEKAEYYVSIILRVKGEIYEKTKK